MGLFNFFKKQEQKSSKTSIAVMPAGGGVQFHERDYETFCREAYIKNAVAFTSIDKISKSVSSVPWAVYKKVDDGRMIIPNDPIMDLIRRPNPQESWAFLMQKLTSYYVISGNGYIEKNAPETGNNKGVPRELYILRPDYMEVKLNERTGLISAYIFDPGRGKKIIFETNPITGQSDILHIKTFHPLNEYYGLGATEPVGREIDTSNDLTVWNKKILENDGKPGIIAIITGDAENQQEGGGFLSDKQYEQLRRQLESRSGAENAGRNLIIEGGKGTTVMPYQLNPKDLDYIEGGREMARKIANGYGVPAQLIGIPGESKYRNYETAKLAFWEDTVIPYLNMFRSELNAWFFQEGDNRFLDYDLENVPALAPRRDAQWKRAQESDFITINEKREMIGKSEIDGGDVILVQATMIPLGMEIEEESKSLKDAGYSDSEIDDILGYKELKVIK